MESFAPDTFDHAALAGEVLARLHRCASVPGDLAAVERRLEVDDLAPLFRVDASLSDRLPRLEIPEAAQTVWCHGDFHPDQIALDPEEKAWLLDLDLLAPGDPLCDLASWIGDAVSEMPETAPREHARPLLEGYARGGGGSVDQRRLWSLVAEELIRHAANGIRRLEKGAVELAARALEHARELAP